MTPVLVRTLLPLAALTTVVACGRVEEMPFAPPQDSKGTQAQAQGTVVSTRDGARFYGDDVAIDVYNYKTPGYRNQLVMVFQAGNGQDVWTAQTEVSKDLLPTGSGSAQILQTPLEIGIANVERLRRTGESLHRGASGTFIYSVAGDRVSVQVDSDSNAVSGVVEASFQVRCWVEIDELGRDPNGFGEGVLIDIDSEYRTPSCVEYKAYGP